MKCRLKIIVNNKNVDLGPVASTNGPPRLGRIQSLNTSNFTFVSQRKQKSDNIHQQHAPWKHELDITSPQNSSLPGCTYLGRSQTYRTAYCTLLSKSKTKRNNKYAAAVICYNNTCSSKYRQRYCQKSWFGNC